MHHKKYLILLFPAALIFFLLVFLLPDYQRSYALFVPAVFWIVYYTWIYIEKRKQRKN